MVKSCPNGALRLNAVTFTIVQALHVSDGLLQATSRGIDATPTMSMFPPERHPNGLDVNLTADANEHNALIDGDFIDESSAAGIPSMLKLLLGKPEKKRAMMLHLQKMGGSLMCHLAKYVEHVVQPQHNCNWWHQDFVLRNRTSPTCAQRVAHFEKGGFTYGQIERPFRKTDHCPDDFSYFTMMRDPVSAALSIINFWPVEGGHEQLLQCVEARRRDCEEHLKNKHMTHWFDNYMIRFILGPEVYDLPLGEITEEHAQAAIKVLEQFDLVTTLEGFKTASTQKALNAVLGWSLGMAEPPHIRPSPKKYQFTPEQETRVRALLQHDYTLYNHFKQK